MENKNRRRRRVRARIQGTAVRPRISVFRSHRHIHIQLIDDEKGTTLSAADDRDASGAGMTRIKRAQHAGQRLAAAAKTKGIARAVFDRGGYAYHGAVKAAAEAMRKEGMQF